MGGTDGPPGYRFAESCINCKSVNRHTEKSGNYDLTCSRVLVAGEPMDTYENSTCDWFEMQEDCAEENRMLEQERKRWKEEAEE